MSLKLNRKQKTKPRWLAYKNNDIAGHEQACRVKFCWEVRFRDEDVPIPIVESEGEREPKDKNNTF